ncbi:hypothetical protein [Cellvibrio sp. QJXJ]|uniref:hypothetical protein n=1 Tax=Cellvibrio sp. QJXJ TaxID=2964606 RepID=UPI0021C453D4|nr:hypothetical protein [Cellvibrio sp. QJXJ]UUA73099.1 hypothetical protein NNX04_01300 [Cellvibrio sp. QJXJ]
MTEVTKQEMEQLAALAAQKTAAELFERLGIDVNNVRDSQADFAHLRKQRLASEQIGKLAARALVTIFFTGLCSLILLGLKDFFLPK